jgi:DinB superfamily
MRTIATVALTGVLCSVTAAGQEFKPSSNPVSDAVRRVLARDSKNLIGSADLMPADKYSYKPTPAQMSFGQLIVHIVQTNVFLCAGIAGTPPAQDRYPTFAPPLLKKMSESEPKETLVTALKQSFEYCTEAMTKATDAQLGEQVTMFGQPAPLSRADAMVVIVADWADHYSTAASYLRLNGLLPPSAQPKPTK